MSLAYDFNINGVQAFSSLCEFKFYHISFANFINKAGMVYKMIFL